MGKTNIEKIYDYATGQYEPESGNISNAEKLLGVKDPARAKLQAQAELDATNAALNQQKAVELGMQNQVSAEQLNQVYAELKGYQDSETGRGRTLQELDYAFKYGNFDGFNKMIKTDPIVSKAWVDKADKIEAFNPYNSNHIDAYRRAGMPEEVLDVLKASWNRFDNGANEVTIGDSAETGTKYTSEDIKAIQMAYPIVYRAGQYMATTTQDFIAEAGLLKNIYSGDERNRMLSILDKGKTALQGIAQEAYKAKLAKEQAETGKFTAEASETTQKAEGLKYDNKIKEKILSGEGTAESKAMELLKLTDPKAYAQLMKAKTEQKTAEVDLEKAYLEKTKMGLDIGIKTEELGQKKEERLDKIGSKVATIEDTSVAIKELDSVTKDLAGVVNIPVLAKVFSFAPGTSEYDVESTLTTLKSNAFLANIDKMKGLGALSDAEGKELKASIANLDIGQTKAQLTKKLGILRDKFSSIVEKNKSRLNSKVNYQDSKYLEWKKSKGYM